MDQRNALSPNGGLRRALSGVLFAVFFIAGDILGGVLAPTPLPLPGAPAAEVARYYDESRTAALAVGIAQSLSAVSLLVFAGCVVAFVRRTQREGSGLPGVLWALTAAGGGLAAACLLVSALLGLALVAVAPGGNLDLVGALRALNFLTGGTLHVASLGLFAGAGSLAARRARALPGWIVWLGLALAVPALLSLASLVLFPASVLILIGRLLAFVWGIAAGIALARGTRPAPAVGGDRHVLA